MYAPSALPVIEWLTRPVSEIRNTFEEQTTAPELSGKGAPSGIG